MVSFVKSHGDGFANNIRKVVISNRLVTSPCAIVADEHGYTANIEKLISECHS